MPALTHGRVVNGFNLLPRTITTSVTTSGGLCCYGKPIPYTNSIGRNLNRNGRIHTGSETRDRATTVVVGQSAASKRAINNRVTTHNTSRDVV
jgi:hypothetical protein